MILYVSLNWKSLFDNPVRTYSSGMYMRLAFSVAINVDADILLIDEILAVGDNAFQTKCFNKLKSLKDEGTTIVIVSHALGQIEQLCDRAIWIDKGLIREEGPARRVCRDYLEKMEESRLERAELEYRMQLDDEKQKERQRKEEEERLKKELEQKKSRIRKKFWKNKRKKKKLKKNKERERKQKEKMQAAEKSQFSVALMPGEKEQKKYILQKLNCLIKREIFLQRFQ